MLEVTIIFHGRNQRAFLAIATVVNDPLLVKYFAILTVILGLEGLVIFIYFICVCAPALIEQMENI